MTQKGGILLPWAIKNCLFFFIILHQSILFHSFWIPWEFELAVFCNTRNLFRSFPQQMWQWMVLRWGGRFLQESTVLCPENPQGKSDNVSIETNVLHAAVHVGNHWSPLILNDSCLCVHIIEHDYDADAKVFHQSPDVHIGVTQWHLSHDELPSWTVTLIKDDTVQYIRPVITVIPKNLTTRGILYFQEIIHALPCIGLIHCDCHFSQSPCWQR